MAIEEQLRVITEKEKFLISIKTDLDNINNKANSQLDQLLSEKTSLEKQREELREKLKLVDERLQVVGFSIDKAERERMESLKKLEERSKNGGLYISILPPKRT